jgi:hypothetical protein
MLNGLIMLNTELLKNYQSTPLFLNQPTKYTALINTNVKGTSPTFFGTTASSAGRTKCVFEKPTVLGKLSFIRFFGL